MGEWDVSSAAALRRWAQAAGGDIAIRYEGTEISYAQLTDTVQSMAATLAAGGLSAQDRVAYLGRNSALLLETALAAAYLGAVFVPVNVRLAGEEAAFVLSDCGTHTLVAEDDRRALVDGIAEGLAVRRFIVGDTDPFVPAASPTSMHPRWERLSEARRTADRAAPPPARVRPDDPALLMYTSGTTGRPKGAVLTHGNLWWHHVITAEVIETRLRDTALIVAPMYHIAGLSAFTLGALTHGGTVLVRRAFDPDQCLDDLVSQRVANLIGVPTVFAALARTERFVSADLSALRAAIVGGAPVPAALVREYAARGVRLQQGWGLTETAPLATCLPAALVESYPESAGFPMPYTEIELREPTTGEPVTEPGVPAEVCVRGPQVTLGYWNDPQATRLAFDERGWFRSGDVGYLDERGLLYLVDRIKDVIISGGENVYPAEVERVLAAFPGLREVAVVGAPDPRWGESPVAVLCQDGPARATLEEIRAFAAERLAGYKLPTAVRHTDALPRNGSGKVDKVALRAWVLRSP